MSDQNHNTFVQTLSDAIPGHHQQDLIGPMSNQIVSLSNMNPNPVRTTSTTSQNHPCDKHFPLLTFPRDISKTTPCHSNIHIHYNISYTPCTSGCPSHSVGQNTNSYCDIVQAGGLQQLHDGDRFVCDV